MTNLAKVVTSLIAEHMEQVVEDAFQHSRPCDEHVELSETRERCKEEEQSSRTPVHVAATSLEYLSLIEISWYGLFFYLVIIIYRNLQPRPVGVIIILEIKIMPETLFAGMLFQEDAECLVL